MLSKAAYSLLKITPGVTSQVDVDVSLPDLSSLGFGGRGGLVTDTAEPPRVDSEGQQIFCAHYMLLMLMMINFLKKQKFSTYFIFYYTIFLNNHCDLYKDGINWERTDILIKLKFSNIGINIFLHLFRLPLIHLTITVECDV